MTGLSRLWRPWILIFGLLILQWSLGAFDKLEEELVNKTDDKTDNVLKLTSRTFQRYVINNKSRKYDFIIFMTAEQMRENKALRLDVTRASFGKVAKSYTRQKAHAKWGLEMPRVFFAVMDLQESKDVMAMMRVEYVPWVSRVAADWKPPGQNDYRVPSEDTLSAKDHTSMPWGPKVIAEWLKERVQVDLREYRTYSLVRQRWFPAALVGGLLVASPVVVWLLTSPIIRNPFVQCTGALTVYGLSTSGFMNMLIKQMPFQQWGPKGPKYFYEGNAQVQLCAEGFIMGSSYMLIGLIIAMLTWLVPRVRQKQVKLVLSLILYLVGTYVGYFVFKTYYWKTGFVPTMYLFKPVA